MKNKESECLTPDCHCKPISRGLCKTCYYRLLRRVQRGNSKWNDLIACGYCKKARRYKGLTTAVRRKNALNSMEYRDSIKGQITP